MSSSPYVVTRQSNYYDSGAYSVEVAREFDFASPGALVAKYSGEFDSHDDPREAAETAIAIRAQWHNDGARQDDTGAILRFTIAGNAMVYPTVADGMSASELRRWAQKEYDRLPKCAQCGDLASETYTSYYTGDSEEFCCESHADDYFDADMTEETCEL